MSIDDVVDLTITAATVAPTRLGFGTPLIMAYHNVTPNLFDLYKSAKEMTDAGWPLTAPAYKMAVKMFSQNPAPSQVAIGKRLSPYTQTLELFPLKTTQGYHYKFTVTDPDGVATDIDYAVPGAATIASIVTALVALLQAITDAVVTDGSGLHTNVKFVVTAGKLINISNLPVRSALQVVNATTDPGIAADIAAVSAVDATTWYGMVLDSNSKAEVLAAAAANEATRKIFGSNTSDTACTDPASTTDVMYSLKSLNYARTYSAFCGNEILSWLGAAWMAAMLPQDPGSATWAFKKVIGVASDMLTGGESTAIWNKNGNTYQNVGGVDIMQKGTMAQSGVFIDITWFLDWLHARMQERILGILANSAKIPYTDSGVDVIRGAVLAQLNAGVKIGGLADDGSIKVTAPKVADVDASERINRNLPDVKFQGNLAGAIQSVKMTGTVQI